MNECKDYVIKNKHFKSVFDDEQTLLLALLELHNKGQTLDLDPMFFKGNFYKDVEQPKLIFDLNPQYDWIPKGDATNLLIDNNSINSMILDPPFMFGGHGTQNEFYSSRTHGILSWNNLEKLYKDILKEAKRILKKNGLLIFKCQDYTDAKTTMTHCLVYNMAIELGFYAKDLGILVKPNKVYNGNTKQRHLRKIHTYFWVFIKRT